VFLAFHKANTKEDFAWAAFWTRWGQIDGPAALEYAAGAHPELGGSGAGTNAMEGFMLADSTIVRRWLTAHPDLPAFDVFARVYIESLAKTDVSMATQDLFTLPLQAQERYSCFGPIIREALNSGGTRAVEGWFGQLNDLQKKEAFVHAAWAIKDADLDAATSWYSAQADKPWRDANTLMTSCADMLSAIRQDLLNGFCRFHPLHKQVNLQDYLRQLTHGLVTTPRVRRRGFCKIPIRRGLQRRQAGMCAADVAPPRRQTFSKFWTLLTLKPCSPSSAIEV
jgi:hypothetical protein